METKTPVDEQLGTLVTVLQTVRFNGPIARSEIVRRTGLGRAIVIQRLGLLIDSGILVEGDMAPSTGGRPSREIRFRSEAGSILSAELGATSIGVGITDLQGSVLYLHEEDADVTEGPEVILRRVEHLLGDLIERAGNDLAPIWGMGVGLPGPVEFATGRPVVPPIMPGWDGYAVRERLSARFGVPVWVDNDVNVMAVGELRAGRAIGVDDVLYVKVGTGIGSALISGGRLHRGAIGVAGDIGHIAVTDVPTVVCRCGQIGCLEAVAGGFALGAKATSASQQDGASEFLRRRGTMMMPNPLTARDLADAAAHGDAFAVTEIVEAGNQIGRLTATLVNFFNPALILFGGGVVDSGDLFLAAVREAVYRRSLPLATRDLRIERAALGDMAGIKGAAICVVDNLLGPDLIGRWLDEGSPAGMPQLVDGAA